MLHLSWNRLIAGAALFFASTSGVMALESQDAVQCTKEDTIQECWDRWNDPDGSFEPVMQETLEGTTPAERRAAANKKLREFLVSKLSPVDGQDSAVGPGLKDFLNLFAATVENAEVNEGENSLNLTWNFPLLSFDKGKNAQLQAMVHEATVYSPLQMAIPEAGRADRVKTLEQQLDDASDITLAFSYTALTQRLGRSFAPHSDFYEPLFAETLGLIVTADDNERVTNFAALLGALTATLTALPDDFADDTSLEEMVQALFAAAPRTQPLAALRGTTVATTVDNLVARVEAVASGEAALTARVQKAMGGRPIHAFSNLVNNQPQLSFTASHRSRDELVGPDQTALEITFEKGLFNLNSLNRYLRKQGHLVGCQAMAKGQREMRSECLKAVETYSQRVLPYLADANRFTFKASYNEVDAYDFTLPGSDDGMQAPVMVNEEKIKKLIASVAYGRVLTLDDAGDPVSRFDLEAKYEDIMDGKTVVDNRFIVTAIYTRQLTDSLSLPLSLVWANKDEFLPEVDEKFSANFGIRFRVKGKDQGDKGGNAGNG